MSSDVPSPDALLAAAEALAESRGSAPQVATLKALLRALYRDVAPDDLAERGAPELLAVAEALAALARERSPGEAAVRIVNPTPERDGWASDHTVIDVVNDDMPFLVDSVAGVLGERELAIHTLVHPQVLVRRDPSGEVEIVEPGEGGAVPEGASRHSFIHLEIDQLKDEGAREDLRAAISISLADVRSAVDDWPAMRATVKGLLADLDQAPPPIAPDEVDETREFLAWVDNHHFTFLGVVELEREERDGKPALRPRTETARGVSRRIPPELAELAGRPLTAAETAFLESDRLVQISKSARRSTVHRPVPMDVITVKRYRGGRVAGEVRYVGLFTSMAYSITASRIPLVRKKVDKVVKRTGYLPASHDFKLLRHIVENYPRDELFQISEDQLLDFGRRLVDLQLRPRPALFVRHDQAGRFLSCMVYVPRDGHSTAQRHRIQRLLEEETGGEMTASYTQISDRPLAQLQFILTVAPERARAFDQRRIETKLADIVRQWSDRLKEALVDERGEDEGLRVWREYGDAFPVAYQEAFDVASAVEDLHPIARVRSTGDLGMRLYRREGTASHRFHFRTFELATPATLSALLPKLENMGVQVLSEIPFEVRPRGASNPIWVRDFELAVSGFEVDPEEAKERFQGTFARVWSGAVEDDGFNRLVLRAGLTWRQVVVLRAYCKYLRQTGIAFSQPYMEETLAHHPRIARLLVELFEAHLDPGAPEAGRSERTTAIRGEVDELLAGVSSLDQDRILRRYLALVEATLRTNHWQTDEEGAPKPYLSLKLAADQLRDLPKPRPQFEIFVYSPRVEAVHLRGGKVARGGIRWSDRREDFRTEILGLLKAQLVKNAVIVPVGAKGGFVVKHPPHGREELQAEGIACYKTLIHGLLDLTDNLVDGEVAPPPAVVRRDGDDTYLVVAADKGTATFSDIANRVAQEHRFWLGDAFASGGSHGYDHKKIAITARGAWEGVKRHFREMGLDCQREPFTAVGVGDMSGDVFGNGMLLSRETRLVAAFNHLHIFVDPEPDPARSFAERKRLFELPRSTWADYDRGALSPGGAIYERQAKQIRVSPEVADRFELAGEVVSGNELVKAILKARVDLLWFGGIGTYVKGRSESNARVGDRANDEVRVNGADLRCKVVGEGANLAMTQLGRVELARRGARLNTDFIDNSGGVDCSDHEVNIKIALGVAVDAGEMSRDDRDRLLVEMTDDVAELVLHDNYLQTQAISLTEALSPRILAEQARFIRELEREGRIDRRLDGLPDEATIAERQEANKGLTRPEIAILLAHSKILVYNELLDSDLPDDPRLVEDLVRYFPRPMRAGHRAVIERHRLRREIIATHVTNSMVNRVGPTFVARMAEETGRSVPDIARAYAAARDVFDLRSLWEEVEELDNVVAADLQTKVLLESVALVERATRWFLRNGGSASNLAGAVADYNADVLVLAAQLEEFLPPQSRTKLKRQAKSHAEKGLPGELAKRVAGLRILPAACDVSRTARTSRVAVERVGKIYFAVGERFDFDRLHRAADALAATTPWEKAAVAATADDLLAHQAELTRQVVALGTDPDDRARYAIDAWIEGRAEAVERLDRVIEDFAAAEAIDLSMLVVGERELRRVVALADRRVTG